MRTEQILDEMLRLLEQNRIPIRKEPLGGSGAGLCKLKSRNIFFYDTQASPEENAFECARAIKELLDIDNIYLVPAVREFIESER